MIIVAAGRSRSASTLLYNIIRLTLSEVMGSGNVYGTILRNYNKKDPRDCHVIKTHGHDEYLYDNADYVFSSAREELGQRLSILRHQKLQIDKNLTSGQLDKIVNHDYKRYLRWKSHKNFKSTFEFEKIINDKEFIISSICNTLDLIVPGDIQIVLDDLNSLNLPDSGVDPVTGLTSHHITNEKYRVKSCRTV